MAHTDRLDAQVWAQVAATMPPTPRPQPDAATQQLSAVVARRQQVVDRLTAEKNRLPQQVEPALRKRLQVPITWLTKEVERTEQERTQLIQQRPAWQAQDELM